MADWSILQLRDGGDPPPVTELERDFRARHPEGEFRFPAIRHGELDRDNPLSTYVFVRPPIPRLLEASPYIRTVLRYPGTRQLQLVSDGDLQAMVPLPDLPPTGSTVEVTAGDWTGIRGVVVDVNCRTAKVLVELWSRQSVLTLAANELRPV